MAAGPRIALSQLGFPDTTFDEDIAIATKVGAGISPDEHKLVPGGEVAQSERLATAGVGVALGTPANLTILQVLEPGMPPGPTDPDERIATMVEAMRRLAPLRPVSFLFITGPAAGLTDNEARSIVIEGIRTLAGEAKALGMSIAIETMREPFRPRWTIVTSLGETLDLLEEVGDDDVGIIFDTWHMWDSKDVLSMIPVAADRIHGVQIADYRDPTRSAMDRVVAGDGIGRIDRLVAALREAGYDGWYEMEIFSDDGRFGHDYPDSLWKLDPLDYATRQIEGFMRCWA